MGVMRVWKVVLKGRGRSDIEKEDDEDVGVMTAMITNLGDQFDQRSADWMTQKER